MLNQIILVGKIKDLKEEGFKILVIRCGKNEDHRLVDEFYVAMSKRIAKRVCDSCHEGDTVGIKGRLKSSLGVTYIQAEKISLMVLDDDIEIYEKMKAFCRILDIATYHISAQQIKEIANELEEEYEKDKIIN